MHFFLCKSSSHTNKYITGTLNKGQPLQRGKGRKRGRKGRGKGRGKKGKGKEGEGERRGREKKEKEKEEERTGKNGKGKGKVEKGSEMKGREGLTLIPSLKLNNSKVCI